MKLADLTKEGIESAIMWTNDLDLDTLRVRFDPRPPDPGKSRIEPLFQDVLY